MRPLSLAAAFFYFTSTALFAARDTPGSALNAIDQLPRGESKRVARVEARDGSPIPERWHIIVHDPKDENGLREYVIASSEVVASRTISQFAESVRPEDVINTSTVRIDSDRLADLAQQFALANNATIAALNYALKKEGAEAVPLWSVGCVDDTGKEIGRIVVSATKGNVISHEGFTARPGAEAVARAETQSESEASRVERRRQQKKAVVRAIPVPTPEKKDVFSRVGNSLNKFFTGKNKP